MPKGDHPVLGRIELQTTDPALQLIRREPHPAFHFMPAAVPAVAVRKTENGVDIPLKKDNAQYSYFTVSWRHRAPLTATGSPERHDDHDPALG